MTPTTTWHPTTADLQRYIDGGPSALADASVEAHLLSCRACREAVRDAVPADRLLAVLEAVEDRIDRAERPWLERLACRLGIAEVDARALLAAPSLRAAWWGAVVGSVLLALVVAEQHDRARTVFLLLAPLLPALTTAIAYGPELDQARPIVAATPYSASRLLLARSLAVGATAIFGALATGLALPHRDLTVVVWLLPALALTLLVLAATHWVGTGLATGGTAAAWFGLVIALDSEGLDPLVTFDRSGQLVWAALALLALIVVVTQQHGLDEGGPR